MPVRHIVLLLSTAISAGCLLPQANSRATNAVATGEPLAIVDDVKVWTTTSKEKVGETVYKDSGGKTIGTADTYQERTHVHSMEIWYPVQGAAQLADEDFFRIAGDEAALSETLALRENGKTWNRRGKYTMLGGLIGVVAGFIIPQPVARTVLVSAGGLAVSGGWYMARWGAMQMAPDSHAVDRSIAERAARSYNQRLEAIGASVGKTF